ncbi:MAG: hypothetical protein KF751_09655 [Nitrospira sp.]|nr:hypothetical protein [Nitrospira sp.]MBX3349485.1 hypothetical protein [Nitrospira sp.]
MKRTTAMNEAVMTVPRQARKAAAAHAFPGMTEDPDPSFSTRRVAETSAITRETTTTRAIVIGFLNEALGTAIIGILRYKQQAFKITGIGARRVKTTLLQHAAEEQAHANHLAERIKQLGGKALLPFEQLLYKNCAEQLEKDSLAEMVRANLLADRSAIYNYRAMIASIGADDPATRLLLERILAQKEKHAENLGGLLRD